MLGRLVRRQLVIHPFLFAAYPILFLLSANVGEADLADVWMPLALALAAAAITFLLAWLVLRDAARAALVTTIGLVAFFGYGHLRALIAPLGLRGTAFLAAFGLAVLAAVAITLRAGRVSPRLTTALNVAGVVLIVTAVAPVAGTIVAPRPEPRTSTADAITAGSVPERDIWYIVLDRYASRRSLERYFGITQPRLYDRLEEIGFQVIENARSNYGRTIHSLASSLNLRYLDEETARYGADFRSEWPLKELVQEHAVGRFLKDSGYTYYHLGSHWDPTERNRLADVNPRAYNQSDFLATLVDTTLLPQVSRRLARRGVDIGVGALEGREQHYSVARFQFAEMASIASRPGRKFVFVHILLPHGPYVFNADGSYVTAEQRRVRSREESYRLQLEYTDTKMIEFLDRVIAGPEDQRPIVVLQADEGPYPRRYDENPKSFVWTDATDQELDEKFGILNAYYLPGFPGPGPYPGITPVNSFRMLLRGYFDAELPLLPDRTFIHRNELGRPLDFVEFTERLADL